MVVNTLSFEQTVVLKQIGIVNKIRLSLTSTLDPLSTYDTVQKGASVWALEIFVRVGSELMLETMKLTYRQSVQGARANALIEDAEMLLMGDASEIEVEGELERTWRVGQSGVVQLSGQEAAKGRKEYKLDGGPYRSRHTRNGR